MGGLRSALVACIVIAGSAPSPALGVDLAPVVLTPDKIQIRMYGSPTSFCSPLGSTTASLSAPFTYPPGFSGALSATATLYGSDLTVSVSGSGSGEPAGVGVTVDLQVAIDVPELGDSTSPLYLIIAGPTESGPLWVLRSIDDRSVQQNFASCGGDWDYSWPRSTLLGAEVNVGTTPQNWTDSWGAAAYSNPRVPQTLRRTTGLAAFPAGDHIVLPLTIEVALSLTASSGSFDDSFVVQFRSLSPAIGNGNLNGDQSVDIVDSTILRQHLAGFPPD